jgi:hypothetical protein
MSFVSEIDNDDINDIDDLTSEELNESAMVEAMSEMEEEFEMLLEEV